MHAEAANLINERIMIMYCGNCGFPLSDDAIFCTRCGTRLHPSAPAQTVNEATAPLSEQTMPVEQAPVNEQPAPVSEQTAAVEQAAVNEQPSAEPKQTANEEQAAFSNQPFDFDNPLGEVQQTSPNAPENQPEKEFFGKGAFAFCLVVIAILAIACGIFAGLYFGGADKPTAGAVARDTIIRDYFDHNYEGGFIEW